MKYGQRFQNNTSIFLSQRSLVLLRCLFICEYYYFSKSKYLLFLFSWHFFLSLLHLFSNHICLTCFFFGCFFISKIPSLPTYTNKTGFYASFPCFFRVCLFFVWFFPFLVLSPFRHIIASLRRSQEAMTIETHIMLSKCAPLLLVLSAVVCIRNGYIHCFSHYKYTNGTCGNLTWIYYYHYFTLEFRSVLCEPCMFAHCQSFPYSLLCRSLLHPSTFYQ